MKDIVVVWFDPNITTEASLESLRDRLIVLFGEDGFLIVPTGVVRIEVVKR